VIDVIMEAAGAEGTPVPTWVGLLVVFGVIAAMIGAVFLWRRRDRK
jgi:hypothetical protein